jgi:hypothetical protein
MSGGSMSGGTPMTPKPDNKTGGAMGGDSAGGAHGTGGTGMAGEVKNQTQSGMTNANGNSTLGSKMTKMSPTGGAAVTAKGDTLKKKAPR